MFITVYITTSDNQEAEEIGGKIVEEKLAACANILPNMHSVYGWKGEIEKSEEAVLLLKTREENFEAIEERVKELHSYENPCIVAFPILKGSREYLEWINEETKK